MYKKREYPEPFLILSYPLTYYCLTDLSFLQCQWVYRAFEDVEELQRERGAGEKVESPFSPYPVENGAGHEDSTRTNGAGRANHVIVALHLQFG